MNFPDSAEQVEVIISRAKSDQQQASDGIDRFQREVERLTATRQRSYFVRSIFESLKESWTFQDPDKENRMWGDRFFLLAPDQMQRVVARIFLPPDMYGYQTTGEWNEKHCRVIGRAPSYPIVDLSEVASLACTKCGPLKQLPIIEMLGQHSWAGEIEEKFTLCLHCGEKKVIADAPYEKCEQLVAS